MDNNTLRAAPCASCRTEHQTNGIKSESSRLSAD